ncbi:hypothetical protein VTN00DRAFT_7253 [Thermoascus crustaceus]|uniref:uncharacterized protein n=1 Tax=Thermoascus crustaceus TaxID=5088 RepID=UPI0037426E73
MAFPSSNNPKTPAGGVNHINRIRRHNTTAHSSPSNREHRQTAPPASNDNNNAPPMMQAYLDEHPRDSAWSPVTAQAKTR